MRVFSIIVLVLLGLIILGLLLYLIAMRSCFRGIMARKNTLKRVRENSKYIQKYKIDVCWWTKYKFEDLTLISEDGLKLHGHYLDRSKDKIAILVHGYAADYREMANYAKMFYNMGYSILAVENRGHGASEGKYIGMGWLDRLDLLAWTNFVADRNPKSRIVLFGLSMGASTVCMTLGEKLPANVVCAIADCGFDNIYKQFEHVYRQNVKIPSTFILKMFNKYMSRNYSFNLKDGDALQSLKRTKLPVLFIHGSADTFVPTEMVYRLADCIPEGRREVVIVEGAGHALSYPTDPIMYEHKVKKFLKRFEM